MSDIIGTRPTSAGLTLLAKAIAGQQLIFTRGAFGDSYQNGSFVNPSIAEQLSLTALINERMSLPIADLTTGSGDVTIELLVKNANVQQTFQVREVGLFARDPDTNQEILYCYIHYGDTGFIMPAASTTVIIEFFYKLTTAIGAAENVTAVIDRSSLYTTLNKFLEHVNASNPHPNLTLPVASADSLGGVKIGTGLSMNGDSICAETYTLPVASADSLGGVKVGNGLGMAHDAAANMILGNGDNTFIYLKPASATQRGGVKVGDGLSIDYDTLNLSTASTTQKGGVKVGSGLSMNGDSICAETYTLPVASADSLGGVKVTGDNCIGITSSGIIYVKILDGLEVDDGVIKVRPASTTQIGGIKPGTGLSMNGDTLNCTITGGGGGSVPSDVADSIAALDRRIYALEHPPQTIESALVLNTSAGQEANFSLVGAASLTSDGFFTLS